MIIFTFKSTLINCLQCILSLLKMSIGDREYVRRELGRLRARRHRESFQLQDEDAQMVDDDQDSSSSSSDTENLPETINENRNLLFDDDLNGSVSSVSSDGINDDNQEESDDNEELLEDSEDDLIGLEEEYYLDEIEELRQWALMEPPIPHSKLEELLKILKRTRYPELPKCAKTFLGTNNTPYKIEKLTDNDSGEIVYVGIAENLKTCVNPELHENHDLQLLFNIDGLPLYKSSSMQFWSILCKVFHQPDIYKPFPVAIYCGNQKPSCVESYLRKFVIELNQLLEFGVQIDNLLFQVSIKAFICDRLARSFVKCIKSHGGYWACERCEVEGQRVAGRTVYPINRTVNTPRTNDSFRNQSNHQHHIGVSPLLNINPHIDMINDFVLDSMHLVYLGIVKKYLIIVFRVILKQ